MADTQSRQELSGANAGQSDAGWHTSRQIEQLQEVPTTVEARGDVSIVAIEDHRNLLTLLSEQQKIGQINLGEPFGHVHEGNARIQAFVAACRSACFSLDRKQLCGRSLDDGKKPGIGQAAHQKLNNHALQSGVTGARPQGAINRGRHFARLAEPRIDGVCVRIATRVWLQSAKHPLRCAGQTIEVGVAYNRLDLADSLNQRRINHLGAGTMLCFGCEHESRIVREASMFHVVVMIDPSSEALAQTVDELERGGTKSVASIHTSERNIKNNHPAAQLRGIGQLARCSKSNLGSHGSNAPLGLNCSRESGDFCPFAGDSMARRPTVALAFLAGALSLGQLLPIRHGHAAPVASESARKPLGQCSLQGRVPMASDEKLYASSRGNEAVARFTGLTTPVQLTEIGQSAGDRVRIRTGFGAGDFRLNGFLRTSALPLLTRERVAVVEGHLWLDRAQQVKVLGHEGARFEVELSLTGELQQSVKAWASCETLMLGAASVNRDWSPPNGARGYVMNRPSLELHSTWKENRTSVVVLRRSDMGGGVLLFGTERRGGFVRIHYSDGIVLDAWAAEDDLQALPAGETLDQLPATGRRATPRLTLADSPQSIRLDHETPVRLAASSQSSVIGYAESGSEVFVVQSIAGWTSVLPKPLTVAPLGTDQFWIRTADNGTKK